MDKSNQPIHRGMRLYVRPARLAAAIEPGDGWLQRARACMIAFSAIWGGLSSIAFSGTQLEPWKRRMLRRHDPDYVASYWPTVLDQFPTYADGDEAEAWIERQAESLIRSHQLGPELADQTARDWINQSISEWKMPESVANEISAWLPLLSQPGRPHVALEAAPWEYVSMAEVDQTGLPPLNVVEPPLDDDFLKLLMSFRLGDVTPRYAESLVKQGAEPIRHRVKSDELEDFLAYLWTGQLDQGTFGIRQALAEAENREYQKPSWAEDEAVMNSPMVRSTFGLAELVPRRWRFEENPPVVVVVGDSLNDFCLAMAYERLYGNTRGIWMPQSWMAGRTRLSRIARSALRGATSRLLVRSDNKRVFVTSASLGRRSLGSYLGVMRRDQRFYGQRLVSRDLNDLDFAGDSRRWCDTEIWDRYSGSTWDGIEQLDRINTPMPTRVRTAEVSQMSWQVDVIIDRYDCPPLPGLASALTSPSTNLGQYGIRPSSNGISYKGISPFVEAGAPLDRTVVSPRLRTPGALEVLSKLGSDRGLQVSLSSAGAFTQATLVRWGSLGQLARDLISPSRRALVEAFHVKKGQMDVKQRQVPGVWLDHTKRRYLTFEDAVGITGMPRHELRAWMDTLIERSILNRGAILQCSVCRLAAWYPIEVLGFQFTCMRCRSNVLVAQKTWKQPLGEPQFFYELSEVIYQGTKGDVPAIVISLNTLQDETRHSFGFSPQLDLVSGDRLIGDLDLAAIADGRIFIGEAKSTDRLGDSETKEREVLNRLHIAALAMRADGVVLPTSASRWRAKTKELISEKLDSNHYEIRIEEGVGS